MAIKFVQRVADADGTKDITFFGLMAAEAVGAAVILMGQNRGEKGQGVAVFAVVFNKNFLAGQCPPVEFIKGILVIKPLTIQSINFRAAQHPRFDNIVVGQQLGTYQFAV